MVSNLQNLSMQNNIADIDTKHGSFQFCVNDEFIGTALYAYWTPNGSGTALEVTTTVSPSMTASAASVQSCSRNLWRRPATILSAGSVSRTGSSQTATRAAHSAGKNWRARASSMIRRCRRKSTVSRFTVRTACASGKGRKATSTTIWRMIASMAATRCQGGSSK